MKTKLRNLGIDIIKEVPWGTHLCQFYQTKEDLIDILVTYFKAGLENNEFCMWITSEPLTAEEAKEALTKKVKNLDDYIKKGQIEILDYNEWYTKFGKFDADKVQEGWVEKETQALNKGFDGLRLTGNTFWLESKDWTGFVEYETTVDSVIGKHRMIAICSYSLDKCGASEIIDVMNCHQGVFIRRRGKWEIIKNVAVRQAEEALREREKKYRQLIENINEGIWVIDENAYTTFTNPRMAEILGYTVDEMQGRHLFSFMDEQGVEICKCDLERRKQGIKEQHDFEFLRKNGERIYALLQTSAITDDEGNYKGAIAGVSDITKRKRAEKLLKESEQKYSTLVEQAKDGVAIFQDGIIKFVNRATEKLLGYTVKELIGKSFLDPVMPEYRELVAQRWQKILSGENVPSFLEAKLKGKDGAIKDVEVTTTVIQYNGKPAIMVITRDITMRKKVEEELQKMQKLESLGVLAGGIAHDFNNLLTAIIGNLSLVELYAKSGGGNILEVLEETKRASHQTRRLTQQLLTFSTGGEPIKKGVSIAESLKDTAGLALSGSNVIGEFSLPDDLWWAEVDEGQIDQAINNMIINAKQAMAGGGTIRVWAENVIVGAEEGLPLKEGKYVKVSIKDQGIGIMKEYLPKIFDPYFTTKQAGSGLGLAITYSIINKHGGHITVESEMGAGTTFIILLPAFEKETFSVKNIEEEQVYKGKGSILFMDDQENIKNMVRSMLNQLGYEVEFVGDGTEAIEIYKKAKASGQKFDAVILDLTIPGGMGGKETIRKLYEIDPEIKAIVSSGYHNDPIMSGYEAYGFKGAIAKPYEIQELSKILYKLVNCEQEPVPT